MNNLNDLQLLSAIFVGHQRQSIVKAFFFIASANLRKIQKENGNNNKNEGKKMVSYYVTINIK